MLRKRERESDQSMEKVTTKKKKTEVDDFTVFNISECIQEQLKKKGITSLFDIQKSVFKKIHSQENVIAASLTGSGKTLSFVIPILQGVKDNGGFNKKTPMVLVMAPTRELSIQVGREFSELSSDGFKFKTVMVYGGVSIEEQINNLRGGADIIVGTPGRIIDMIDRGNLKLNTIQTVVLDEADKMLTMGFQEQIEDIFKKIYDNKKDVQVCLLSATIQQWVKDVASKIMNKREYAFIDLVKNLENKTPKTVQHLSVQCLKSERVTTIADLILCYGGKNKSTIVFVNTKADCNNLMISDKIKQEVQIIHGDINQKQREATIEGFKKGKFKCLVATDVASRGLDIPSVDLIIQSEPPKDVDTYIHRAGRTARAGREGVCITLYTKIQEDLLKRITRVAKIQFKKVGAPQKDEIISSNLRDITHSISAIDPGVKTLFEAPAKKMIETYGAEEAITRLLAFVSGHTEKLKSRSVLCGAEGYITYIIKATKEFTHLGYIWGILKKLVNENITSNIRGMKMFKSKDGAVFDILEEQSQDFEEVLFNDRFYGQNYTLEKATSSLPETVDSDYRGNTSNGNKPSNGFNSNSSNGRSSSSGNRNRDREKRKDIFVGNLTFDTTENELKELLSKNGVSGEFEIRIAVDKDTGNSKGFGFVSVYDDELFENVIKCNGKKLNNRVLRINSANK